MNRTWLFNSMCNGTPMTFVVERTKTITGLINGMIREDGSGQSWIVLLSTKQGNVKLLINTKYGMRARVLA